jgi:hypothetical protein
MIFRCTNPRSPMPSDPYLCKLRFIIVFPSWFMMSKAHDEGYFQNVTPDSTSPRPLIFDNVHTLGSRAYTYNTSSGHIC